MRLALALGWFNYEAMLESGDPRHLEQWHRYYMQEPFGREWHCMSSGATTILNELRIVASGLAGHTLKEEDLAEPFALVPGVISEKGVKERKAEIDATRAIEGL